MDQDDRGVRYRREDRGDEVLTRKGNDGARRRRNELSSNETARRAKKLRPTLLVPGEQTLTSASRMKRKKYRGIERWAVLNRRVDM